MKQMTFADAEYVGKRNQTRRERFLIDFQSFLKSFLEPRIGKA
jgi:IS5 family transposase